MYSSVWLLAVVAIKFINQVMSTAPLLSEPVTNRIQGEYIVVLKDDADVDDFASAFKNEVLWDTSEGKIRHEYRRTIKGFSSHLSWKSVQKLRDSELVKYIEEDGIVYTLSASSWGLDRVDQRDLPLEDNAPNFLGDGTNTHVYIIDSGVQYSHNEFTGRTGDGVDLVGNPPEVGVDCQGHGTHCAGTAVGTTYGVAKNATVHSLRVFGCFGGAPKSVILAAMEWVAQNAGKPAVVSMSLGGSFSQSENDVVQRMVNAGIFVSVSAGNENKDACENSPASAPAAVTVGSTDSDDKRSFFSNVGRCVDIFAPGGNITSAAIAADNATVPDSGTSMACPHVSGAAAALLSVNETLSPQEVKDQLLRASTLNRLPNARFLSPNRILYIGKDTCLTQCGSAQDINRTCQCDLECSTRRDCCADYTFLCSENAPSCNARCGSTANLSYPCQCDEACFSRQDCCQDYAVLCRPNLPCDDHQFQGTFYSPYFPDDYLNNQTCRILITSEIDEWVLVLTVRNFDMDYSVNCSRDSLTIYDGNNDTSPLIGKYCGRDIPYYIPSSGQHLYVIFRTDSSETRSGIRADVRYRPVCNFTITAPGNISSSNFPSNYNSFEMCFHTLTAAAGEHILVTFDTFDIVCPDAFQFFDSGYANRYAYIGGYCGNSSVPSFSPMRSSGQSMFLAFSSDASETAKGYRAIVTSVKPCNSSLTAPGTISSRNYPAYYYNRDRCFTKITSEAGKQIVVTFTDFELEEGASTGACYDYLQIYDAGFAKSDALIDEYCGATAPFSIRSSGQDLFLVFSSDRSVIGRGYKADVTFVGAVAARLVGGRKPHEGRVEISHHKYGNGTICDINWDIKDASVVCNMLHYGAAMEAPKGVLFGEGSGRVILDEIDCDGSEINIDECQVGEWRRSRGHCRNHRNDVGAICYQKGEVPLSVRLVGGNSSNVGRVEIRIGGQWGSVCDDDWDREDADVVCRSLGYRRALKALRRGDNLPGDTFSQIFFDNVACKGDEAGLEFCNHNGVGNHNCAHSEDAGVECMPSPLKTFRKMALSKVEMNKSLMELPEFVEQQNLHFPG